MRRSTRGAAAILIGLSSAVAFAGPDEVELPENFHANFVNYLDVDRFDRLGVRKMWVNPDSLATAVAGDPLPMGTVLIMEVHAAKTDADGNPMFGPNGRLIAEDAPGHRFVMEKNADWQTANGYWDYAWYQPDGALRPDANYDGCFACHANREGRDYTFTFWKFVADEAQ